MVTETENPMSTPRRRSRIEVWLLIIASLIGLLGFMSTLSSGDDQEIAVGADSQAAAYARQPPDEAK
jgi:hypothetical protein